MRDSAQATYLGSEGHATITEILADRGTVWLRVDSGHQMPEFGGR